MLVGGALSQTQMHWTVTPSRVGGSGVLPPDKTWNFVCEIVQFCAYLHGTVRWQCLTKCREYMVTWASLEAQTFSAGARAPLSTPHWLRGCVYAVIIYISFLLSILWWIKLYKTCKNTLLNTLNCNNNAWLGRVTMFGCLAWHLRRTLV